MHNNSIYYFTSKYLLNTKIKYGFFTRNGGISNKPFDSLNCSFSSNDFKKNVTENINLAKKNLNLEKTKIKFVKQMHGNNIEIIDNNNINKKIMADGCITKAKDICLAILTADCVPIFLTDTDNTFICAIHSGWNGCLNNIISKTSNKIKKINKSLKNIIAIIGPCLDKKNFEIKEDFKKKFINKNIKFEKYIIKNIHTNKMHFDMRGLIEKQLIESSINNIFHIKKDTYSEESLFFSHRRATHSGNLPTGRMINIIGFKQ